MSLSRYYTRVALLPTVLIVGGSISYTIYDLHFGSGKDYKSEWLTADTADSLAIFMAIIHCLIVCGLCSSIFLNRRVEIRENPIWSSLSWFLPPLLYFGYLFYLLGRSLYHRVEVAGSAFIMLSAILPYLATLVTTFIHFRRSLRVPDPRAGQ